MPEPETIALDLTCAECERSPEKGETWRVVFADKIAREAFVYCPSAPSGSSGARTSSASGERRSLPVPSVA
jgi:hypothetical protein